MNNSENIFVTHPSDTVSFYADTSLDKKTAGTCDLFILPDKNTIQLSLKERRTGNILAFEIISSEKKEDSWNATLENASAHSKILRNYEFLRVTAGIMSPEFTLIPEALFKPGDEAVYLKKNFPSLENRKIYSQLIPAFHLHTVFAVDNELESELNHLFQDPQLWHYSQAMICGASMKMKTDSGKKLWLNIRPDKLDIIVTENKKLILLNTFSWQTNEDILYYTLFVSEQLEMDPEKFPMTVSGEIDESSSIYQLLFRYVRNISFPEKHLTLEQLDDDFPSHHFALLYNLALCE